MYKPMLIRNSLCRRASGFSHWRKRKLSGLVTEADVEHWTEDDIWPYMEHVLEVFGFDRIMFGSDWPVCLLALNMASGSLWSRRSPAVLRKRSDGVCFTRRLVFIDSKRGLRPALRFRFRQSPSFCAGSGACGRIARLLLLRYSSFLLLLPAPGSPRNVRAFCLLDPRLGQLL